MTTVPEGLLDELLHLSVIRLPGMVWVQLEGELDLTGERPIALGADETLAPEDFVVLDARGVTFCDVTGLQVLTDVLERWGDLGHAACCLLSPPVERVARLLSADDLLVRNGDPELLAHVASATVGDVEPPIAAWEASAGTAASTASPARVPVQASTELIAVSVRRDLEEVQADAVPIRASSRALRARQRVAVAEARRTVAASRRAQELRAAERQRTAAV
jgi:anti-anti-sigma regulatory factor